MCLFQDRFFELPHFKSLRGDPSGTFSRRVDYQHRVVYEVLEDTKAFRNHWIWSYYEPT